jgi:hypothetical protein
MGNYQKAVRYATKLIKNYNAPYNPKDLVHDAYVQWYRYKESDLMDQKEGTVIKTVKNLFLNKQNENYYQIDGKKAYKVRVLIEADNNFGSENIGEDNKIEDAEKLLINQENEVIIEEFINTLCEFDKRVLDLRFDEILDKSQNNRTHHLLSEESYNILIKEFPITKLGREIKDKRTQRRKTGEKVKKTVQHLRKVMHTKSPFVGSKLTIIKRVKRKDFERDKEEYLNHWEMGEESDFNESFVQMTSKTNPNEGLLIKEKDSD